MGILMKYSKYWKYLATLDLVRGGAPFCALPSVSVFLCLSLCFLCVFLSRIFSYFLALGFILYCIVWYLCSAPNSSFPTPYLYPTPSAHPRTTFLSFSCPKAREPFQQLFRDRIR